METYIRRRQKKVAQYISTKSLLDLCEATERNQGEWVAMRWWEKSGIDMVEARYMVSAVAAAEMDEDGMEE